MSLSDKTDYEINKLVASVIYHDVDEIDQDWVNQTSGVHVIFKVVDNNIDQYYDHFIAECYLLMSGVES